MTSIIAEELTVVFDVFDKSNSRLVGRLLGRRGKRKNFLALEDISFSLTEGDKVALIGKNGAGKTTLLKAISGILPPTSGILDIHGQVMSAMSKTAGIMNKASCLQNIALNGLSFGLQWKELKAYIDEVSAYSELGEFLNSPVSNLSAGMKSRLIVSMFNCRTPEILLMDEWIGATDKKVAKKNQGLLSTLVDKTEIFVLASHREALIKDHCNKAIVLEKGKIAFFGEVDEGLEIVKNT